MCVHSTSIAIQIWNQRLYYIAEKSYMYKYKGLSRKRARREFTWKLEFLFFKFVYINIHIY